MLPLARCASLIISMRDFRAVSADLAEFMSHRPEVLAAYLFGSVVNGRLRSDSDIDVAVLVDPTFFNQLPSKYRADLIADVGAALETFNVDIVLLNEASAPLAHNVITKGRLVFERSRSARIAFQVRNLNLFLDLEPIHSLHLASLKRRYLKG